MYDLSTKQESAVSTRTSNQNWPDISTNYVIYADDRNGNWDIFMYRISTQEEFTICTNTYAQTFPVISGGPYIGDLTIAYMDDRSGKNIYIYYPYYFGSSGYEYLVPLDKTPIISTQAYPHFDNSQLVYQDLYGVNDGVHYSVWEKKRNQHRSLR
jgi:beta propeller repeat protein